MRRLQAAHEQSRRNQQQHRQRDLSYDQQLLQVESTSAVVARAGCVLERRNEARPRRLQRRRNAEHEARDEREHDREEQHAPIDGEVNRDRKRTRRRRRSLECLHCAHARPSPTRPPTSDSRTLSVSSCRTSRARLAPMARRTASSRRRAVALASNRLAIFAHAISSTAATTPPSRNAVARIR